jgi:hypothetical protein
VVLRIDTSVIGNYATALADEVDCLVGLLSPVDPSSNPRGLTSLSPPASAREVSVPAKTVFKVALRDYLYTKDLAANASAGPVLEVVEDVAVDGVTVFRKGALAKGKLTEAAAAKSAAHGGSLQLALESATAVDGQEIAVEGGSGKTTGEFKPGVYQQEINSATVAGGMVGGLLAALTVKGYEALIPAGATFEAQVAQPVKIKAEPGSGNAAGPGQAVPATSRQSEAASGGPASVLNVSGLWSVPGFGLMRLMQAPWEKAVIGRAEGYDIEGAVEETRVALRFMDVSYLTYSLELAPKGDANTLAGQMASGQIRPGGKTKPLEIGRVLSASLPMGSGKSESAGGLSVNGTWYSRDWGKVTLVQVSGEREVAGKAKGQAVDGFVNGTHVILNFSSQGKVNYSADLVPKGDGALAGQYSTGYMLGNSQTKPTEMSKAESAGAAGDAGKSGSAGGLNVEGTWNSHDWGTMKLVQAAGQQDVTGKSRGWDIDGFVSGTHLILYFSTRGIVSYSAELTAKGDDTIEGQYAPGQVSGNPKTKPMEMRRQK